MGQLQPCIKRQNDVLISRIALYLIAPPDHPPNFEWFNWPFSCFPSAVALAFFAGSLILLNLGRGLGTRRLAREGPAAMAGLNAVEGAVL